MSDIDFGHVLRLKTPEQVARYLMESLDLRDLKKKSKVMPKIFSSLKSCWDRGSPITKMGVAHVFERIGGADAVLRNKMVEMGIVPLLAEVLRDHDSKDFFDNDLFDLQQQVMGVLGQLSRHGGTDARLAIGSAVVRELVAYVRSRLEMVEALGIAKNPILKAELDQTLEQAVITICHVGTTEQVQKTLAELKAHEIMLPFCESPDSHLRWHAIDTIYNLSWQLRKEYLTNKSVQEVILTGLRAPDYATRICAMLALLRVFNHPDCLTPTPFDGRYLTQDPLQHMLENPNPVFAKMEKHPGSALVGMLISRNDFMEAFQKACGKERDFISSGRIFANIIMRSEYGVAEASLGGPTEAPMLRRELGFSTFTELAALCATELDKDTPGCWESGVLRVKSLIMQGKFPEAYRLAEKYARMHPTHPYFPYARIVCEDDFQTVVSWGARALACKDIFGYLEYNTLEAVGDQYFQRSLSGHVEQPTQEGYKMVKLAHDHYSQAHKRMPMDTRSKRRLIYKLQICNLVLCDPATFPVSELESLSRQINDLESFVSPFWGPNIFDVWRVMFDFILKNIPVMKKADKFLNETLPKLRAARGMSGENPHMRENFPNIPFSRVTAEGGSEASAATGYVLSEIASGFSPAETPLPKAPPRSAPISTISITKPPAEMSVSELRKALSELQVDTTGCIEKSDLVEKLQGALTAAEKSAQGTTEKHRCSFCGNPSVNLKVCAPCKAASVPDAPRYCNEKCQKEHWKVHKAVCVYKKK